MNDPVDLKYEEYEKIHNGLKSGFVTQVDTSLIHKGHRAHGFYAGHDSRNPEVAELKQDCKNLVEINNNQAKIVDGLQIEIKRAYDYLSCCGVPRKRAHNLANGIDVLATRFRKEINLDAGEKAELKAENKKLREDIKLAYNLITQSQNEKSPEEKCKAWNEGFSILKEIAEEARNK